MPKTPRVTGRRLVRALQKGGWYIERQRGSHIMLRHPDKPEARVTLAVHSREVILPKTLASILAQAGLTVEELIDLL